MGPADSVKGLQKKIKGIPPLIETYEEHPSSVFKANTFTLLNPGGTVGRGVRVKGSGRLGPVPSCPRPVLGDGRERQLNGPAADAGVGALVSLFLSPSNQEGPGVGGGCPGEAGPGTDQQEAPSLSLWQVCY